MALNENEVRVLVILGLVILILWAFFGLFWSLLLVFTFLVYAYNFGRRQNRNSRHEIAEYEPDVSFQEKLHDDYPETQDLPFTGLPKEQFNTLRSPMPLLSEVTKRLNFNTSTITPFQARKMWPNHRELGTPYLSRGSPVAYWRKSNHFSLLNPALQRPTTVKIASPDVTINRTFNFSNSPRKRTTPWPDHVNPCSRITVLSALKESRKRSYVVDEDEDLELLLRPAKRRGTKQVSSKNADSTHKDALPLDRPFFSSLKRSAIHDSKETITDKNTNKRSKVIGHSVSTEPTQSQTQTESMMQKRKNVEMESIQDTSTEDTEESKSKKAKDVKRPATAEIEDTRMEVNSAFPNVTGQETEAKMSDDKHKESSTERSSSSEVKNVDVRKTKQSSTVEKSSDHKDEDDVIQQPENKAVGPLRERKRFTVPRFLSKEDSRRRAVPVYCASNEESEMPQRRNVGRKINQEQIKIDRKLAWERVKKFLDDDDEEEDEEGGPSKPGTSAVSSTTATTCTSSSLFKIPTAHAVTSTGSVTTTITQSLITPALATGFPQHTTGSPLVTSVPQANQTVQGNIAVTQSQASLGPLLQSQQALGSGLLSNLSSVPGLSTNVLTALPTATTKQENSVTTTCASLSNLSRTGLQATVPLTSTATSLSAPGFQCNSSSASSVIIGNSPFSKSTTTDQLTSLSNPINKNTIPGSFQLNAGINQSAVGSTLTSTQNSAQKHGFSFPAVSSSGVSGTSTGATTTVQGGFNFPAPSATQNAFGLNKNNPETGTVNSPSTFAVPTSTSQNTVVFGGTGNILKATSQNPFGSLTKTTAAVSSANPSSIIFGQSTTNTAQSSFGLTAQNKGTFGSTNMQSLSRSTQQTQSAFGGSNFGAALDKSSTQSPFGQATFGTQSNQNTSQSTFGSNPTQNAFGAQPSQPASQSAFGGKSAFTPGATRTQNTFGSQLNQSTGQNVFGNLTSPNTFGSQPNKNTTQSAFGTQATQNAFGAQNQPVTQKTFGTHTTQDAFGAQNQPVTQKTFGTHATQNAFGAQMNQPAAQSAFAATANQASKSSFSFATNTVQNTSNSPFGSFGNKPATQSTFGSAASQNAAGPSGGFNFGSPAGNSTTGGNKTGGFQFGPLAAPAPSAPSGGFDFTPGSSGMAGSPFGSSSPAPAFGAPGTPQGANSVMTARTRARVAARRRGKK